MNLTLHPRVAPSNTVRVWLGAFGRTTAPSLRWALDRHPAIPTALREITSVRLPGMLKGNPPRAFVGLYEFEGLAPDTTYRIAVRAGQDEASIVSRTLPTEISHDSHTWFNVLLVSCFHRDEDRQGLAGNVVASLPIPLRPHMTVLLGDQVYLDLPTLQDFENDTAWLAEKFERDYARNWRGPEGYARILAAAPSVSIPDDHEYWNNFPHASPFINNSYTEQGRRNWRSAAQALYEGFQLHDPHGLGSPVIVDVPPLSFFLADSRTFRDERLRHSLRPDALSQLEQWVPRVSQQRLFGVFVNGQSMLSSAAEGLSGTVGDRELSNYEDFPKIAHSLSRLTKEGRPLMLITGDVHWGRVTEGTRIATGRQVMYEVISSPTTLVTTIGKDQLSAVGGFFSKLFGKRNPWPRHSDPELASAFWARDQLGRTIGCRTYHRQKGNHVALLAFRRKGFGLEMRVRYLPIHHEHMNPVELGPIHLGHA